MKLYISYFGQMRNFTSNMLPISTATWDAQWFKGIERIEELICPGEIAEQLERQGTMCRKQCPFTAPCEFMRRYKEYLETLDFTAVLQKILMIGLSHKNIDTIVLMVYEKDDVQCAERPVLQEWFAENGIQLPEWKKIKTIPLI